MSMRTLGVVLAMLCMMTTTLVVADDMAIDSSGSGKETLVQLLSDVQEAVADDPALSNMFNISSASQKSEEELKTILQNILTASLSGSLNASSNLDSSYLDSVDSAPATGSTISGTSPVSFSVAMTVLATVVALGATA